MKMHALAAALTVLLMACACLPLTAAASAPQQPVVLVIGGSGRTGLEMMRAVNAAGLHARGMTRDGERTSRTHPALDWVTADARDPQALRLATQGVQYVICAIGAPAVDGPDAPQFVDYLGVVNVIDAAVAAGVQHFVLVSSGSAGPHREPRETPRLGYILLWKTLAENHLKGSGLDYTIIGPGGLDATPANKEGLVVLPRSQYTGATVSRRDVARVAVDALTNTQADGKSFALINRQDAETETWREQLHELPADATDTTAIENLSWLAGHWTRAGQGAAIEELWLPADAGIMLGINRSVTAAGARAFEWLRIEERADGVYYLAAPGGGQTTEFKLLASDRRRARFASPTNDFPRTIEYRRDADKLTATVDGTLDGKPVSLSWTWSLQQSLRVPFLPPQMQH